MTSKINYIRKNTIYLCHCDLRIVLIFNNKKISTKKNITKIFIILNVILRIQITNIWHII